MNEPSPEWVTLAFYKGHGGSFKDQLYDQAIRTWTGKFLFRPAKYSHVTVVFGGRATDAWEASPRWGGVRHWDPGQDWRLGNWDFIEVPIKFRAEMLEAAAILEGQPYDWEGIWLSMAFRIGRQNPGAWFCSEFAAMLLAVGGAAGFGMEWREWLIHPQALANKLLNQKLELITG